MSIPESKFNDWKGTGADAGSAEARESVKSTLELARSPLEQKDIGYQVYLQGSYKNTTHTWGSSDVDVVVKCTSTWKRDLSDLSSEERDRYFDNNSSSDYSFSKFRDDVYTALGLRFKSADWMSSDPLSKGNKAIEIDSEHTSIVDVDVDVVSCLEYRVYHSYPRYGDPDITRGMHFTPRKSSETIINYPKIHYENGKEMHRNYKETVRIFKNARDYYNKNHLLKTADAPSYFIECMIYNVPENILQRSSRSDRFIETLNYVEDSDLTEFDQVSEQEAVFGSNNTQWDTGSATTFLQRMRELWDNW